MMDKKRAKYVYAGYLGLYRSETVNLMLLLIAERFSLCSEFLCLNVKNFSLLVTFCRD